jgi:hypothetical protein
MALVFAGLAALALHPSMTRRRPPPPDL